MSGKLPKVPKVDTVRLNVGGRLFETCAETLADVSFFEPLLAGRFAHPVDNDGCIFVDRAGPAHMQSSSAFLHQRPGA